MGIQLTDDRHPAVPAGLLILAVGTIAVLGYLWLWTLWAFYPQLGVITWQDALEHPLRPWARLVLSAIISILLPTTEIIAIRLWLRR